MANQIITNTIIAEHSVAYLRIFSQAIRCANRFYEKDFALNVNGYKLGQTIPIKLPTHFTAGSGPNIALNDLVERETFLTLDQQLNIGIPITGIQYTTQLTEISERIIKPAMIEFASRIDRDILLQGVLGAYNVIGTAGTPLNSFDSFIAMQAKLQQMGVTGDYFSIVNVKDGFALQSALANFFNRELNEEIDIEGHLGKLSGINLYRSNNMPLHKSGNPLGVGLINGAGQVGNQLITDGWNANIPLFNVGDVIYISTGNPLYQLQQNTLQPLGNLASDQERFVITQAASSDGAGNAIINIEPGIILTGQYQTVSNSPDDNAVISMAGGANILQNSNFMFSAEAFTLAIVPMQGVPSQYDPGVATDPETGISVRVVDWYDGTSDRLIKRMDVLYARKFFPQYAVRYIS